MPCFQHNHCTVIVLVEQKSSPSYNSFPALRTVVFLCSNSLRRWAENLPSSAVQRTFSLPCKASWCCQTINSRQALFLCMAERQEKQRSVDEVHAFVNDWFLFCDTLTDTCLKPLEMSGGNSLLKETDFVTGWMQAGVHVINEIMWIALQYVINLILLRGWVDSGRFVATMTKCKLIFPKSLPSKVSWFIIALSFIE